MSGLSLKLQEKADKQKLNGEATELVKVTEVEGTPFRVIDNEGLIDIVLGNHVVKRGYKSVKDAIEDIEKKSWDIILVAGSIFNEVMSNNKKK